MRFLIKFPCKMDFGQMPFDAQRCSIHILSYSHSIAEVRLTAKDGQGLDLHTNEDGGYAAQTQEFWVSEASESTNIKYYGTGGDSAGWDLMRLTLTFERKPVYYLRKDLIYATFFVFMSYVGFFINRKAVPARAAMALIPVLTELNHINGVESQLPPLSKFTWLSTFLTTSLLFTLIAVMELCLVNVYMTLESSRARSLRVFLNLAKRIHSTENPLDDREQEIVEEFFHSMGSNKQRDRITARELRKGMRSFDVYWSLEQSIEAIEQAELRHPDFAERSRRSCLSGHVLQESAVRLALDRHRKSADSPCLEETDCRPTPKQIGASPGRAAGEASVGEGSGLRSVRSSQEDLKQGTSPLHPPLSLTELTEQHPLADVREAGTGARASSGSRRSGSGESPISSVRGMDGRTATGFCDDGISREVFRTLLFLYSHGKVDPAPPIRVRFRDKRPSVIVDIVARRAFFAAYVLTLLVLVPFVELF
jgi:hypothetical protein